jgi:uncharacterized protein YukE
VATSAASTVDASALVTRAIAPFRSAIDGILREVSGDPAAVQRVGETYRAGASSSTQVASNVTAVASGLSQSWRGPAGSAYAGASQDLTGQLSHVQATLNRQADVLAEVARAQIQARSAVEQARGGLDAAERSLLAASRSVSPAAVPELVRQAQLAGAQFQSSAAAQRDGLAGVLRQAAANLNQAAAQRPPGRRRPGQANRRPGQAGQAAGGFNEHHWRINPQGRNIRLADPRLRAALDRLGDEYYRRTGRGLTVTDGDRSAADQASRMYDRLVGRAPRPLRHPNDPLGDYNQRLREPIRQAYLDGVAARETEDQIKARMTRVIEGQIANNEYVSRHLRNQGADIRIRDMTAEQLREFDAAVRATGDFTAHVEGDHRHLNLRDNPQPQPAQPQPAQRAPGAGPAVPPGLGGPPQQGPWRPGAQPPGPWPDGPPQPGGPPLGPPRRRP